MSQNIIANEVEIAMRALLAPRMAGGVTVRASHQPGYIEHPCVIVSARKTGDDYRIRTGPNRRNLAATIALTFLCRVEKSAVDAERTLNAIAKAAAAALDAGTAADVAKFAYFQALEPSEQAGLDENFREITLGWTVTALLKDDV